MKTPRPESDWIQILVPSIIDKPTFDFVQQQLKDNRAITKKTMSHPFLLSGLLYCGICGQKMTVHHSIFRNGRYMPYYVCASQRYHNLRNAGLSCKARSLPAVAIDNDIWEILQKINLDPLKLENYLPEMQKENMNESNQLLKMESALITQRETILIWYRKKKISDEQAEKQLDEIGQQLAAIAARIKNISPVNVVSSQSPTALSYKIKALFESNALSDDIKKRLLRGMFKKIIAARTDGHKGRRQIPVFRIALEFFS
jgi:site-specific DNA recombinase